ncbi:MAG: hypothetical protein H6R19_1494 [Proteobacteria bacterium]|nr:hypothetical protein [Pseudomonadota bacterium]
MKFNSLFCATAIAATLLTTGCAHNINISPVAEAPKATAERVNKTVGMFISAEDRALEVVSPGGGGDKLSYLPYKDLEGPLFFTLSNVYSKVETLPGTDAATVTGKNVSLVFSPKLTTTSSSSSAFTWPPTDFSVTIKMKAIDNAGKVLWEEAVTGNGKAEFAEFKADFPLAARRASKDALEQLEKLVRAKEGVK